MKSEAGSKIREYREKKEYTLKEVAEKIGVTLNYISLIERGLRVPCDDILYKLSEVLEVNVVEIFSLYNKIPPSFLDNDNTKPNLFKMICEIERNKEINTEDKKFLLGNLQKAYKKILARKGMKKGE
ncbi:MAG: helix-turn-helix transcriptional regulator [Clostridium sp.]|uniref:helix-turn-helix domain-containing protein n=1 Tax=Clostridium sp. TaxID=1506 RepID=UPI0025B88EBF|nr:helix-turn-helix transcriptional regulator [Clostridium sp.]MCI9069947.1 helix-turn-helix transcriptional regulator [Clostridium sp.]MCI9304045.1 helix-turn-helix transcriptional regulator [Clostridium sp.]